MSSTDERLLTLDAPFVEQEGSSQTSDTPQTRKFALTIPKSINMRIRAIQKAERRNLGVVLTKCIEDYLRDGDGDSLPYLPSPLFHEDNAKLSYECPLELSEAIRDRAETEARTVSIVFTKAIFEYIRTSPDDPVKTEKTDGDLR